MRYFIVILSLLVFACTDYKGVTRNPVDCISMVEVSETDLVRFTRQYVCEEKNSETYCRSYKFNSAGVCEIIFVRKIK